MDKVRLSSGGVRANLQAGENIPADRVWKYSDVENEVVLCDSGEEADGICLGGSVNSCVNFIGASC